MKDFYYILATDVNCTSTEIKEAYEKLSKKLHPDLYPNDRYFENQFREISEAYETLSDPIRRRKYDEELKAIKSNSLTFAKRHPSRTKAIDITFTIILIAFTLVFGDYVIKTVKNSKAKKIYKAPALTVVSFHKIKHYKRKHSVKIKTISSSPKIDSFAIKTPAPIQAVISNHNISSDNNTKADNNTNSNESINSNNLNSKNSTTAAANLLYTTYLKANETGVINMREFDNFGSRIIKVIPTNSKVLVLEKGVNYYKIVFDNTTGYVAKWNVQTK